MDALQSVFHAKRTRFRARRLCRGYSWKFRPKTAENTTPLEKLRTNRHNSGRKGLVAVEPMSIRGRAMKKIVQAAALVAFSIPMMASAVSAGPIERACMRSDRKAANSAICACIQQVADMTLRGADQRKAAGLITDPDKAQKVWLSKSASDDAFWERYKAFGAQAEAYCAG